MLSLARVIVAVLPVVVANIPLVYRLPEPLSGEEVLKEVSCGGVASIVVVVVVIEIVPVFGKALSVVLSALKVVIALSAGVDVEAGVSRVATAAANALVVALTGVSLPGLFIVETIKVETEVGVKVEEGSCVFII